MSYEDLHVGIIELFADAAQKSRHTIERGELPTLAAGRWTKRTQPRPRRSSEEHRAKRREIQRRQRATKRAAREADLEARRKATEPVFWVGPPPEPMVWQRFYVCARCASRSATHRCPGLL